MEPNFDKIMDLADQLIVELQKINSDTPLPDGIGICLTILRDGQMKDLAVSNLNKGERLLYELALSKRLSLELENTAKIEGFSLDSI